MRATSTATSPAEPPTQARATRLRFAHLSDPHLTTLDAFRARDLHDQRILGYLSWRRRRRHRHERDVLQAIIARIREAEPDHVVITGDLTHIGHPDEIDEAVSWLESLGDATDVTLVPGNHDLYVSDPNRRMLARWARWLADAADTRSSPTFPSLRVREPVAFIGLSSAAPSAPLLATGRLGSAQLDQVGAMLDATGRQGLCRVVLVHHAPLPGQDPWRKRLRDAGPLCEVLKAHGAELVLHGHGHQATQRHLETGDRYIPVLQAPSASATTEAGPYRAAWNLCTVEREAAGFRVAIEARGTDGQRDPKGVQEHRLSLP